MFIIELRPSWCNANYHNLWCLMKHFEGKETEEVKLAIVPRAGDNIDYKGQTLKVHSTVIHAEKGHGEVVAHCYVSMI